MPVATTLADLKTQLDAGIDSLALTLSQQLLPDGGLLGFVRTLPDAKIALGGVQVALADGKLTVSGDLKDTWQVPYLDAVSLSAVKLTAGFAQASPDQPITSFLTIEQAQINISGQSVGFKGALESGKTLKLELLSVDGQTAISLQDLANFATGGRAGDRFPDGLSFFDSLKITKAAVSFGFGADQETSLHFTLGASGDWVIIDKNLFALKGATIALAVTLSKDEEGGVHSSAAAQLGATAAIAGQDLEVSLGFQGRYDWAFSVLPAADKALPSLSDLAGAVGGASLQGDVQKGLKALGIDEIAIDGITVRFDPYAKKLKNLSLSSHMVLLGGRIDLLTVLPDFQLTGGLPVPKGETSETPGSAIHLKQLAEHYFGSGADFPNIDVTELSFSANPKAGDYLLAVQVTDDWQIAIGQQSIALKEAGFRIHKAASGVTGEIDCQLVIADVDFTASASHSEADGGWVFEGSSGSGQKLDLTAFVGSLLQLLGVTLPSNVPEITLDNLDVRFDTATKDFDFKGETDAEIDVPFIVTGDKRIHAEVNLASKVDSATGKRSFSGFMEGDLTIGSSVFTLQYALAQESHVFKASWESSSKTDLLGFDTLLEALGISNDVSIPKGLDLNLKKVYLEYQAERETLKLVADSATYGTAFFVASKLPLGTEDPAGPVTAEGNWSFVFGLEFTGVAKLSKVPVLGKGLAVADIFQFQEIGILISSATFNDFTIPQLPPLAQLAKGSDGQADDGAADGAAPVKPIAADTTLKLTKGISFVGVIDLASGSQSGSVQALRTVVPQAELLITATFDAGQDSITLKAVLDGSVAIPTGGSSDLKIGNAGLEFIFSDGITFELFGDLALHFDAQTIDVTPRISISAEEAEFSVDVAFEDGWKAPMGIEGLTLDEVGFEIGVNFLPAPGLNLGLEGQSHIGTQAPKSDDFAFVLEVIEEVPDPLLLSFYLEEIDVKTAMQVFAPSADGSSLPGFVNDIKVTQLSFYWAESVVTLPDGTVAQPGLRFSGNVEILSFEAHAALAIDQASGIQGDFELSPIHVQHILDVTGHGKGVYLNMRDGKPVRETALPAKDTSGIERVEVVPPGGAVLQFRTTQSPYLVVSLIVTLLDLEHEEVEGLITDKGFTFKLIYQLTDIVKAELDVTLGKEGFHLYSQFGLHLKADIGPIHILGVNFGTIHLDTGFDLELSIDATAQAFSLNVSGDFEFEGARLTLPTLHLEVAPASLTELPKLIIEHVEDKAEEIFKDLFDEARQLAEAAGKEIAHLAEEAGQEIEKIGEAAVEEADKIVDDAEQAVVSGVKEAEQEVAKIGKEAEQIASDAAQEVEKVGAAAAKEVEKVGKEIAKTVDQAAHEIAAIGQEIAQEAEAVGKAVARLAQQATQEVAAIAKAAEREVAKILGDAKKVADHVLKAARQVVHDLEQEAKKLLDEAKHLAEEAKKGLEKAGHAVEKTAKKAWHAISKY